MPTHLSSLPRQDLSLELRRWNETQRRVALERVIEYIPDDQLAAILEDLALLETLPAATAEPFPSIGQRAAAHAIATRSGEFLGDLMIRNQHGQRSPWQTHAWSAATWHLFDIALKRTAEHANHEAMTALQVLVELVEEVTDRVDELVVFEDSSACFEMEYHLRRARTRLTS